MTEAGGYVDKELLTKYLHNKFPEYKRQKISLFRKKVISTFENMKENQSENCTPSKTMNDSINDLYKPKEDRDVVMVNKSDLDSPVKLCLNGDLKRKMAKKEEKAVNLTPKRPKVNQKAGQVSNPELTFTSMGGCEKAIEELYL